MSRRYTMRARAAEAGERRERIVDAALELFLGAPYDEGSLQAVADRAGVALKTVVRQFGSKEALFEACVARGAREERARREVVAGDVGAAVRALADRYEELAAPTVRYLGLEDRLPVVGRFLEDARAGHLDWLATTFAPWLPARGAERSRRLAALFGATEVFVWWTWRQKLGYSRAVAEAAMREMIEALIARWTRAGRGA